MSPAPSIHRSAPLAGAGHRQRRAAAMSCAFGLGAALAALLSSADAQFLSRVGTRHLGTAFALSSAVSMVLLWRLGAIADRRDRGRLLLGGSVLAIGVVIAIALGSAALPRASAVLLLVASKQIGGALELLLWVVIADRFTARQARRLLPWVVAAHGAGGALGALAVGPSAQRFGASAPVWLAAGLLVLVASSARLLLHAPHYRQQRRELLRADASSAFAVVRRRPLARWLALLVACAGIFAPMMYYLLGVSAAAEYPNEVELAGFLGNYRAYVQGAALIAQLAIAPRLAQRLGVGPMLLLAPVGALVAAAGVGMEGGLFIIVVAQALTRILDAAIQTPVEQLVQNLLPQDVRGRVAGLLGGVAKRSGTVLGGLAASALVVWPALFASSLVVAALLWCAVAVLLRRRFAELAVQELSSSSGAWATRDVAFQLGDERALHKLRSLLASADARERGTALALLARLGELGKVHELDELLAALRREAPGRRDIEQRIWLRLGSGEILGEAGVAHARELVRSERASEVALGFALLSSRLANSEPAAIAFVVDEAERARGLSGRLALARARGESILDELVSAGHEAQVVHELRCEVARALRGESADRPDELGERLLRSLARTAEPVLQAAGLRSVIASLADNKESAVVMLVRSRLSDLAQRWQDSESASLREASLLALVAGDRPDLRVLVSALGDREDSVRRQAETLLRAAGDEALAPLSVAAQHGRRHVRMAAIELLADLRPSSEALALLLEQELLEMTRCSQNARALVQLDGSLLVQRRLHERVQEAVATALMALEARATVRSQGEAIGEVARRLARAASERSRARALEALDALLPRKIAVTMLGAMEGRLDSRVDLDAAVKSELPGRDPLTRDLLVHALGSAGRAQFRDSIAQAASTAATEVDPLQLVARLAAGDGAKVREVPGLLETIVALSELSLFEELSTVQLEELARVVVWQHVPAAETLMTEGEEGNCMYFVRSGTLAVIANGATIATIAAGEPVGELALFAEERRTATVVAAEPVEVGVLTREDMERLVDEVPGIALQLCRAMSRRLATANRKSGAPGDRAGKNKS